MKYHKHICQAQREAIFHRFCYLGNINRQRDYIQNRFQVKPKASANPTSNRTSRRKFTKSYTFMVDGNSVPVCKLFSFRH